MKTYYIGADLHCNNTEIAIETNLRIEARYSLPTSIAAVRAVLDRLQGKKYLAVEETTLAGWFYRHLKGHVDQLIVCDPRRNHLIAADGDSDDKIDAAKLAALLRGGFLRPVHHSDDDRRVELKQWISLYHRCVQEHSRHICRIRAAARSFGLDIPTAVIRNPDNRPPWLTEQKLPALIRQLQVLWIALDAHALQVARARQQLAKFARTEPVIKQWKKLPGIGTIRALTLLAYLDTPYRFASKSKLCKYCGIGLERSTSGADKAGKPRPAKLKMPYRRNGILKNTILGAAHTALCAKENPFKTHYERMIQNGIKPANARHTIARKLLTVLWGIWKSQSLYDPTRLAPSGICTAGPYSCQSITTA